MSIRIHILNASIDKLTMKQTISMVNTAITNGEYIHHSVVNAGKIVNMQTDLNLRKSVNEADIINADGLAVVWASRILGKPLPERVAGIDLMTNLIELAHKNSYKIYLLGAKEEVVTRLAEIYKEKYSSAILAGYRNGYFTKEDETEVISHITSSRANMLFVAMTSPKKENFLHRHKETLKTVNFIMGVGGSFDVIAGKVKRAPLWMQTIGLEWLFRLLQEPKRMFKRYLIGNTKFMWLVLKAYISKK